MFWKPVGGTVFFLPFSQGGDVKLKVRSGSCVFGAGRESTDCSKGPECQLKIYCPSFLTAHFLGGGVNLSPVAASVRAVF